MTIQGLLNKIFKANQTQNNTVSWTGSNGLKTIQEDIVDTIRERTFFTVPNTTALMSQGFNNAILCYVQDHAFFRWQANGIPNGTTIFPANDGGVWVQETIGDTDGTVTSIGITAPAAFTVTGSPVTTSGVIDIAANGTASEYIKGDGTLGTLPTPTGGTVTNVSALAINSTGTDLSSTVANPTTTPVITLSVPTASAVNRGVLSPADWSTFNSKQDAITLTITGTSGAATLVGATLNIPQYQSVITNPVTGTGTTNYLPKWTSSSALGNSLLFDDGTNVGIGTTSPAYKFQVAGDMAFTAGANRYLRMPNPSSSGSANHIIIQGGSANTSGTGGNIYLYEGYGAGGPGPGSIYIGATNGWTTAYVTGRLTVTNSGPNTETAFQVNAGGQNGLTIYWDNLTPFMGYGLVSGRQSRFYNSTSYSFDNNLLIGTNTNAGYKLDVLGTARIQNTLTVSNPSYTGGGSFYQGANNTTVISGGPAGENITFGPSNRIFFNAAQVRVQTGSLQIASTLSVGTTNATSLNMIWANGSITAGSNIARGIFTDTTLIASANNDVLIGLDVTPTFTNGAFTNVTNWAARISGALAGVTQYISTGAAAGTHYLEFISTSSTNGYLNLRRLGGANGTYAYYLNNGVASLSVDNGSGETRLYSNNGGYYLTFYSNGVEAMRIPTTGNVLIGTSTDAGYKLDVNGTARVITSLQVGNFTSGVAGAASTILTQGRISASGGITFYNPAAGDNQDTGFKAGGNGVAIYISNGVIGSFGGYGSSLSPLLNLSSGFNPSSGTGNKTVFSLTPTYQTSGTFSGGITGILYNPPIVTLTGVTYHRAIETVTGDVIFGSTSGNVGVGGAPYWKLQSQLPNNSGGSNVGMYIADYNLTFSGSSSWLAWGRFADPAYTGLTSGIRTIYLGNNGYEQGMAFHTASAGVGALNSPSSSEVFRLTNTRNVLIGTTTDAGYRLDVNGTARVQGTLAFNNGNTYVSNNSNSIWIAAVNSASNDIALIPGRQVNVTNTGTYTAETSALVQIDSTTKGVLLPRMTDAQILAIASPANGLMVYSTTQNVIAFYDGTSWHKVTHTNL